MDRRKIVTQTQFFLLLSLTKWKSADILCISLICFSCTVTILECHPNLKSLNLPCLFALQTLFLVTQWQSKMSCVDSCLFTFQIIMSKSVHFVLLWFLESQQTKRKTIINAQISNFHWQPNWKPLYTNHVTACLHFSWHLLYSRTCMPTEASTIQGHSHLHLDTSAASFASHTRLRDGVLGSISHILV